MSKFELHKLIHGMSDEVYHRRAPGYSSSQLKDANEDLEVFCKKYIHKTIEREEKAHFDVGIYFHVGILEPHLLQKKCTIYPGRIRKGDKWIAFQNKHVGKTILNSKQAEQATDLINCVKNSPVAMRYLKSGKTEVSAFMEIIVSGGEIYAPERKLKLTNDGWIPVKVNWPPIRRNGVVMVIKARADHLGDDYILDLKSTSGNTKNEKKIKDTISHWEYDLSASFYLDIFSAITGREYRKFIWTFASKDMSNSMTWQASETNVRVGRAKYRKALLKIAYGLSSNWVFSDVLGIVEPNSYELEHLENVLDL